MDLLLLLLLYFTLQYCIGFAIHWLESTMGVHAFPNMNTPLPPPSPFHPSGSSKCTSPKHPVSCIKPGLAILSHMIIYMFQCHSPIHIIFLNFQIFERHFCSSNMRFSFYSNFIWSALGNRLPKLPVWWHHEQLQALIIFPEAVCILDPCVVRQGY